MRCCRVAILLNCYLVVSLELAGFRLCTYVRVFPLRGRVTEKE